MTFSIVAFDPKDRSCGVAVASKFPGVGAVVPWARANAGAVATQSFANTSYGPNGLDLMAKGLSAQQALDKLPADDPERDLRQVGLVDENGGSASFTGPGCFAWAGGLIGPGYACQGNVLAGEQVVNALEQTFLQTSGDLPSRLHAALLAADRTGGDRRGRQSAAIYIVKDGGGSAGVNDRWMDYRVDDHEDPVLRLGELIEMHRLYFDKNDASSRVTLTGEPLAEMTGILKRLGYL
ncbi:MAG: hypothetical protein HFACDABA_00339 [Anaerolineales bacterium]|nr:hypothetical protein [Anaerolineales bacterium]